MARTSKFQSISLCVGIISDTASDFKSFDGAYDTCTAPHEGERTCPLRVISILPAFCADMRLRLPLSFKSNCSRDSKYVRPPSCASKTLRNKHASCASKTLRNKHATCDRLPNQWQLIFHFEYGVSASNVFHFEYGVSASNVKRFECKRRAPCL
jgi:hypothetical protein